MVFSSIIFTFIFLPFVLLIYFISKDKYRNSILFISSLLFYAVGEPKAVLLMLISIVINYVAGILVEYKLEERSCKYILFIDVFINIALLYYFKYLDYTITVFNYITHKNASILNIAMPIGISFFTFQAMSYVIDVYRKDSKAEKNIINVGLYISFFPQLVAGPIVRYNKISEQIKNRKVGLEKFGEGAYRFVIGFSKKIILANNLALIADAAFNYKDLNQLPIVLSWIGSIAFSLQIFFDFSGYSDMAIGLGKLFGFDFQENFNYPYMAKNIKDFWRRWHISLSQWFRDYVYIPLGGSKVSIMRHIFNMLVVWSLTGLWHGANVTFIAWGLMYFVMLTLEKYIIKPEEHNVIIQLIYRIITLVIVNCGWVLFHAESFGRATKYFRSMLAINSNSVIDTYTIGIIREYGVFMLFGMLFSTPIMSIISAKTEKSRLRIISEVIVTILSFCVFAWAISFLILGVHNPFIYFNF